MIYMIDTEFIEFENTIELISIGIVSESGDEYYAISEEYDESKASTWVKKNVIDKLEPEEDVPRKYLHEIRDEILFFIENEKGNRPEIWAWYSARDWLNFCWIFERNGKYPGGYPNLCYELKQKMDDLRFPAKLRPKKPKNAHNALEDAKWNLELFKAMEEYENENY